MPVAISTTTQPTAQMSIGLPKLLLKTISGAMYATAGTWDERESDNEWWKGEGREVKRKEREKSGGKEEVETVEKRRGRRDSGGREEAGEIISGGRDEKREWRKSGSRRDSGEEKR